MSIIKRIALAAVLVSSSLVSAETVKNAHDRVAQPGPTSRSAQASESLRTELGSRRAQAIGFVHDYRQAARFPTDDRGMPLSVFMDNHGVRCPMAEIMFLTGHSDLVMAVVGKANDLRLADVHSGPLYDWMLHSGLTRNEIIMVQGLLSPSEMMLNVEAPRDPVMAKSDVVERLEAAEKLLRDSTEDSLRDAVAALAMPYEAKGDIVPHSALVMTEARRAMARRAMVRRPKLDLQAGHVEIAPSQLASAPDRAASARN